MSKRKVYYPTERGVEHLDMGRLPDDLLLVLEAVDGQPRTEEEIQSFQRNEFPDWEARLGSVAPRLEYLSKAGFLAKGVERDYNA